MTFLQAAEALIDTNWEETISGRSTDVPKPKIVLEESVSQSDLKTRDYARIVDGGDTVFTPRGFGWTHEKVEADVTVELRSAERRINGTLVDGRERMFGPRSGMSAPDRYVGLSGETKRILDAHRKGFAEFDQVVASTIRDESSAEGQKIYRADVDIAFVQHASQIDPSV
ncbi:hypothetical protein [Haloarcula pellucida]|uniref:Uncharacterized protein n=1 Tax=Haloarcula pellucida TaxID=1427151 RepID=A0A830GRT0_9EURY|nr:hypothetical protein [Halomicroarcula pellucida]MBX0350475.1 hypothetical protein [Halomicroarcula pellucida]GGO03500.1 hypothetical protein GCM10009030_39210 [Halomicroarcula pellucida]